MSSSERTLNRKIALDNSRAKASLNPPYLCPKCFIKDLLLEKRERIRSLVDGKPQDKQRFVFKSKCGFLVESRPLSMIFGTIDAYNEVLDSFAKDN